jgi:hypothetical protein
MPARAREWACTHMAPRTHVNWFQAMTDLQRVGLTSYAVSALLDLPRSTLVDWKNKGVEPKHWSGELLVELWCEQLKRPRNEIPREPLPISAAKAAPRERSTKW